MKVGHYLVVGLVVDRQVNVMKESARIMNRIRQVTDGGLFLAHGFHSIKLPELAPDAFYFYTLIRQKLSLSTFNHHINIPLL